MKFYLEKVPLKLNVNWKLSRNETTSKTNFYVVFETDHDKFYGEVAPNIRYGESSEVVIRQFESIESLGNIHDFVFTRLPQLRICESLRFGIESCLVCYLAKTSHKSLATYLNIPKPANRVATSYSIPIMPVGEIKKYLEDKQDYHFLKIKVSADSAVELVDEVLKHSTAKLRIDANEGFTKFEDYQKWENGLEPSRIDFIEEPFPVTELEWYRELKKESEYIVMADESTNEFSDMKKCSEYFDAINIKLMKSGSFFQAIETIKDARKNNLRVMLGCMIETSIGISHAFTLNRLADYYDLDGHLLVSNDPHEGLLKCENGFVGF